MKTYLIDSSVILKEPGVLAKSKTGAKLLVPRVIIEEIRNVSMHRKEFREIPKFILDAAAKGVIKIDDSLQNIDDLNFRRNLHMGDAILLTLAAKKTAAGEDVCIVTNDKVLQREASASDIQVLDGQAFSTLLTEDFTTDSSIQGQADSIVRRQFTTAIISALIGAVVALAANYGFTNFKQIFTYLASTLHVWGTISLVVISGPLLYAFRSRKRLEYGASEFFIGVVTAVRVFWPAFDFSQIDPTSSFFQVLGGLYIMIRGLDNIGKALSGSPLEHYWQKLEGAK